MLSVSHLLSMFNLHGQPESVTAHFLCEKTACHGLAAHEGGALTWTQLGRLGTDPWPHGGFLSISS